MTRSRLGGLLERVKALTSRENVRFSRPPLTEETSAHTPSKYSIGGLRHYGEWIAAFCETRRGLESEGVDFKLFMATKTGKLFVKALTDRVFALRASDIHEILLTLAVNKTRIEPLEAVLVRELADSLEELHTFQLLALPGLVNVRDERFAERLKQVVSRRLEQGPQCGQMYNRLLGKLEREYSATLSHW